MKIRSVKNRWHQKFLILNKLESLCESVFNIISELLWSSLTFTKKKYLQFMSGYQQFFLIVIFMIGKEFFVRINPFVLFSRHWIFFRQYGYVKNTSNYGIRVLSEAMRREQLTTISPHTKQNFNQKSDWKMVARKLKSKASNQRR